MTEQEVLDYIAEQERISENGIILPPSQKNLFIQVPIEFIRNEEFTVMEKMVYMYIWTYGVTTRVGFPSQERISKDLNVSIPTLIKAMKGLEKKNALVRIARRFEDTKEKTTSLYYLCEMTTDGKFIEGYFDIVYKFYPKKISYVPRPKRKSK